MNAIETVYKGYRFRSRLEARWAVFFYAMGITWEYEPEGFVLDNQEWYLPDFRITPDIYVHSVDGGFLNINMAWSLYVEVKGSTEEYRNAFDTLDAFDAPIMAVIGAPLSFKQMLFAQRRLDGTRVICPVYWIRTEGKIGLLLTPEGLPPFNPCESLKAALLDPLLMQCYTAARQARFEYGENGGRRSGLAS